MSESEYERLYQEFVRRGGGTYTLDGTNKTPLEFYETITDNGLTPEEEARLTAEQEQYNRQQALNTISNEIANNSFSNPFDLINELGRNAYTQLATNPTVIAIGLLAGAINGHPDKEAILQYFIDNGIGVNWLTVATLPTLANSLYDQLQQHTDQQIANLPQTLQDVSQAVAMAQQFEDKINWSDSQSCNLFNELMGLMSGAFDGMLDFIKDAVQPLINLLSPYLDKFNEMLDAVENFVGDIVAKIDEILSPIMNAFKNAMSAVNDLISKVTGFIDDLFGQISSEVAGLINMANELLNRAKALALAAAAFDVCQLAVLMRTGSNNLTNALQNLVAPLPAPAGIVPTETDPRADASSVAAAMASATRAASTAQGVPQSPLRTTVRPYDPISSYLTSLKNEVSSALSGAISTVMTAAGVPSATNPAYNVRDTLGSLGGGARSHTAQQSGVVAVRSRAFDRFTTEHINDLLQTKNDARQLRIMLREQFRRTDVNYSVAVKGQGRTYIETLTTLENNVTQRMTTLTDQLIYKSEGGKRDESIENQLDATYEQVSNTATRTYISSQRTINDIQLWFDSVKIDI